MTNAVQLGIVDGEGLISINVIQPDPGEDELT